jgi:Protein of unknown function (DUF742)
MPQLGLPIAVSDRLDRPKAERAIAALCHDLLSIAEVSAHLHLPLGVIRVLVGDMADEHLVMVHRPTHAGDRPDLPCWSGCCTAPRHLTRAPDWPSRRC